MEKRIPFDVSLRPEIEAGKYRVETRGGRTARIICWDTKQCESEKFPYPIVALVDKGDFGEFSYYFTDKGRFLDGDTALDLFLVPVEPEPELTEFQKGVYNLMHTYQMFASADYGFRKVKKEAATLLDLARKELKAKGYGYYLLSRKPKPEDMTDLEHELSGLMQAPSLAGHEELANKIAKRLADKFIMLSLRAIHETGTDRDGGVNGEKGVSGDKITADLKNTARWRKGPYYIPSGGAMCLIRTKEGSPDGSYIYYVEWRESLSDYEEYIPIEKLEKLPKEDK